MKVSIEREAQINLVFKELGFDGALDIIKTKFKQYITQKVLTKVKCDMKVNIYYTGIPSEDYKDYGLLMHDLFSGELIQKLSENDADEPLIDNM